MSELHTRIPDVFMDMQPSAHAESSNTSLFATLKRRASSTFEDRGDGSVKKPREASPVREATQEAEDPVVISGQALANDLEQELMCGCCSALLYRPVIVYPCQHYFCGSCCTLWIRNGGTSCPACRSLSTSVSPSRVLQLMVDILLRADPSRGRTDREKQQADEIYRPGRALRIPPPREASPEPTIPTNGDYARPCPYCIPGNRFGWTCPNPVPDPTTEPDRAWHVDDGAPPGHAYCGNCENLLAVQAPTTTRCDMCQTAFCGIGVQGRCIAASLMSQHPHGLANVGDLIQSSDVYEGFSGNTVEVEIMLDYLLAQGISPRHIYRDIVANIQSQPRKFAPLIESDLFLDVHAVAAGPEVPIDTPRHRICRVCAAEVLLWGLRDWWVRERRKGFLEDSVTSRPDCPEGEGCHRQKDHPHAKEFNHIITPPMEAPLPVPSAQESLPPSEETTPQPELLANPTVNGQAPGAYIDTLPSTLSLPEPNFGEPDARMPPSSSATPSPADDTGAPVLPPLSDIARLSGSGRTRIPSLQVVRDAVEAMDALEAVEAMSALL